MIATAATATAIASVAKPFVEPFVKAFVTSKLQEFAKLCKKKGKEIATPKSEHFKAYLERMYDKCNTVKTMAFSNSQLRLKDIYIPLTLGKNNWMPHDSTPTGIVGVPIKLIKKYKKILITDTAGMGKSTILKRIFIAMIDNVEENIGIPIYIELNRLHEGHLIADEIKKELKALFETDDNELLPELIQSGGFVFFLDGYDEIASDIDLVTNDIQDFISKAGPNNYYFLTSRPDARLNSFGDFQSFSIEPLKRKEAFELLTKYDLDENKERSRGLIVELDSGKYSAIEEYLGNPLLVSLLFTAYFYGKKIPLKKSQFYKQVYNALFEDHKLAQSAKPHRKKSLLDIDDFNSVLRYIGYECLISFGVRFDEDTILGSIARARDYYGNLKFGPSAFLKDLYTTVPLFVKDGTEYSWAHKSLMEYFAARFIAVDAKEKQDIILSGIYKSADISKYGNMLDIYYDIDYKGFSKNITLPLCEEYVEYYEKTIINAPMIDEELIDLRKSMLFLGNYSAKIGQMTMYHLWPDVNVLMIAGIVRDTLAGSWPWIEYSHVLFDSKGRSSLIIGYNRLEKMWDDFLEELYQLVRKRKTVELEMKDANQKEINANTWGDNFILAGDSTLNEKWLLVLNDGKIVVEKAVKKYEGSRGIDSHTGMNHPLFYTAFNVAMSNYAKWVYFLDYHACKSEIKSIRELLSKNSSNTIPLPS